MRIVEKTPDRLTLEDSPWQIKLALIAVAITSSVLACKGYLEGNLLWFWTGVILSAGSLSILMIAVENVRVVFDRAADDIAIVRNGRPRQASHYAISDLDAVQYETRHESEGSMHRLRLKLAHEPEPVPLTRHLSGSRRSADLAQEIEAWLDRGAT